MRKVPKEKQEQVLYQGGKKRPRPRARGEGAKALGRVPWRREGQRGRMAEGQAVAGQAGPVATPRTSQALIRASCRLTGLCAKGRWGRGETAEIRWGMRQLEGGQDLPGGRSMGRIQRRETGCRRKQKQTLQALGPAAGVGGIRCRPDGSWGRVKGCLGWGPREMGRCPRLQAALGCAPA